MFTFATMNKLNINKSATEEEFNEESEWKQKSRVVDD